MGRRLREEKMKSDFWDFSSIHDLELENKILRKNVSELQEQLQNAYVRIKDLTNPKQLELDL
tara:strand:- start:346 stop:531 length:186 start_codon:yes stop_codon:yes gene_type:complete